MYIAMNCFRVSRGNESAFERSLALARFASRPRAGICRVPSSAGPGARGSCPLRFAYRLGQQGRFHRLDALGTFPRSSSQRWLQQAALSRPSRIRGFRGHSDDHESEIARSRRLTRRAWLCRLQATGASCCRKSFFEILPTGVFGSWSRISSAPTISCLPRRSFRKSFSSSSVSGDAPAFSLTKALGDCAAVGVRHADHAHLLDRGMLVDRLLDDARIDVVAAAQQHVLGAVDDEDVAVLVHVADVAGAEEAVRRSSTSRSPPAFFQ